MSKSFNSLQQAYDYAVMQAQGMGKQIADKSDALQNHPWGRAYLNKLYADHQGCRDAALNAYEARLMDLSGEASA